jgi:hypothetical protein
MGCFLCSLALFLQTHIDSVSKMWLKLVASESKQAAHQEMKEIKRNKIAYKFQLILFVYKEPTYFSGS